MAILGAMAGMVVVMVAGAGVEAGFTAALFGLSSSSERAFFVRLVGKHIQLVVERGGRRWASYIAQQAPCRRKELP